MQSAARHTQRTRFLRPLLAGILLASFAANGPPAQAASTTHWPTNIKGPTGFADLGKQIARNSDFPANGSEIDKARYVFSQLPVVAKKYTLSAGDGGAGSLAILWDRVTGDDPENADSLKTRGYGNCGEWSYAFQEMLTGAAPKSASRVIYGDKKEGPGHSIGFGGTDTTLIVEERTADGEISRRVFDAFRAGFHGKNGTATDDSIKNWSDRPLTDDDQLPRDANSKSWQKVVGKPYVKD